MSREMLEDPVDDKKNEGIRREKKALQSQHGSTLRDTRGGTKSCVRRRPACNSEPGRRSDLKGEKKKFPESCVVKLCRPLYLLGRGSREDALKVK